MQLHSQSFAKQQNLLYNFRFLPRIIYLVCIIRFFIFPIHKFNLIITPFCYTYLYNKVTILNFGGKNFDYTICDIFLHCRSCWCRLCIRTRNTNLLCQIRKKRHLGNFGILCTFGLLPIFYIECVPYLKYK